MSRTYGATAFADSETKTYAASYRVDELNGNRYMVARHYHLGSFGESNLTGHVEGTNIELGTVFVVERSVTTTFFFLQDIHLSFEFRVRSYLTRVADYHTTFDFVLVDTTEEETYVITSFSLIEEFAEHFHTGNNRFLAIGTETDDLNLITYFDDTGFDTTGSNSTTTGNREYVFNRHQEGFVDIARRQRNPSIYGVHQLHNFFFPFGLTVEGAEGRTANDRSIVAIVVIRREELSHFHFYEFEHFFIVNHIAFVHEDNDTGNVYLASQKNVLTGLGHGTIGSSYHDDGTVHLSSTGNHVLNVVGVTRAVYVCIVTVCGFILYVRSIDRNTSFFFLRSVIDRIERAHFGKTFFCKYSGDGSGQGSFTVVYVANGTNVYMRLSPLKLFFSHNNYFFD